MVNVEGRILGFDLPNGLSYVGRSKEDPKKDEVFFLRNYIVQETRNIPNLYGYYKREENSSYREKSKGCLRIDMGPGVVMRVAPVEKDKNKSKSPRRKSNQYRGR
jgi:hypothetical protein